MTLYKKIYLSYIMFYLYIRKQIKILYNRYFINDNNKF